MTLIDMKPHLPQVPEAERLDAFISEYGVGRVLRATLVTVVRPRPRRQRRMYAEDLPEQIRRDLGLPPILEPPSMGYLRHLR